jgi:hypothetical protein
VTACNRAALGLWWVTLFGAACADHGIQASRPPIIFNEHVLRDASQFRDLPSVGPSGSVPEPAFEDARAVLGYVLTWAPSPASVYPTEQYYYYKFPLGPRRVSGNIRFVNADRGAISVGYFDDSNPRDMITREFRDSEDGVSVRLDSVRHEVCLSLDGICRVFRLDQDAFGPPPYPLLPGEQVVSGIRDESGYYFHLIYWRPGRSFYYVLNPAKPRPERWTLAACGEVEAWFGDESRFCFLHDRSTGRFILVGVQRREIERNTWYDGPFDQVPPRLSIRAILEEAYPYVKDAGGLDEHGNFLAQPGQRVAISPYQAYQSGAALTEDLGRLVGPPGTPLFWTGITYESKRDWRPALPQTGGHRTAVSSAWPPNHWGDSSRSWGPEHRADLSVSWPPAHTLTTSGGSP